LQPADGGIDFYGQFSNPFPTSPDWFPIAVWGSYDHTQANRDLDAEAGINTYVWVADSSFMDDIRADGASRSSRTRAAARALAAKPLGGCSAMSGT
jgi:hypothetical protein